MIDFNVNNYVSVKLTDVGRAHHRADFENWTSGLRKRRAYEPPKEDAEGWSRWQLWHFMELFGPMVHLGSLLPFDPVIRFDSGPPLDLPAIDPSLLPAPKETA
ncbi:hypothetical protein [Variovorax saccharolyticus]|uniref:hypothetical protein n=1 Tax=Variovorax saccharolyticus TaxID=3053516 RepID=UPI0025773929|nr:hypothetical protein [Variovorax sp. J31P216]MDM0024095.1 hypothetical protein [Variovorax sp. J31P216]